MVAVVGNGFEALGRLPLAGREGVSDHFNERRTMVILEKVELEGCDQFDTAADELAINRTEILLVIPVEESHTGDAVTASLVLKEEHRVRLLIGAWVAEGNIHITPELSMERFINMGHGEFMPMTHARLTGPGGERTEQLVLVARAHIRLLRPISSRAAGQHGD